MHKLTFIWAPSSGKAPSWVCGRIFHEKETSILNARRPKEKTSSRALPLSLGCIAILPWSSFFPLRLGRPLNPPWHKEVGGTESRNLLMGVIVPHISIRPLDPWGVGNSAQPPWRKETYSLYHSHARKCPKLDEDEKKKKRPFKSALLH